MGLFGPKYPPLDEASGTAQVLAKFAVFEDFVKSANDRVEVLPGDGDLYAFVGKPPKAFGIVWFSGDERFDVRSAMESGAITREAAVKLVGSLANIYSANPGAERFEHKLAGHKVIVTPSAEMYGAVRDAIAEATG